jgi:hypothetical protein
MMIKYLIYAAFLVGGFILGYAIMWARSRQLLSTATGKTDLARTQNARASDEAARQLELAQTQSVRVNEESITRLDMARTQNATDLGIAAHQLDMARMQNALASAAIDARRGDYESARQAASSFFTSLRDEANRGDDSRLSQAQKDAVEPLFARRDEIISLLSRNDPAATDRLSDSYVTFREFMSR